MKTKEELKELKEEYKTVCKKLHELTEEELAQVSGGGYQGACFVYVVQKGDTFKSIAQRYGIAVTTLYEINNFDNPNKILPGHRLFVPYKG